MIAQFAQTDNRAVVGSLLASSSVAICLTALLAVRVPAGSQVWTGRADARQPGTDGWCKHVWIKRPVSELVSCGWRRLFPGIHRRARPHQQRLSRKQPRGNATVALPHRLRFPSSYGHRSRRTCHLGNPEHRRDSRGRDAGWPLHTRGCPAQDLDSLFAGGCEGCQRLVTAKHSGVHGIVYRHLRSHAHYGPHLC